MKSIDAKLERQILIGMIVSDQFLRDVQAIYKPEYLNARASKLIAGWCSEYWEQYEKAPDRHIQDIFNSKVREGLDSETEDFIGDLLGDLSDESERDKFNAEYLLDRAEKLFKERSLEALSEDIKVCLIKKDTESAEALFNKYSPVQLPKSRGIDPFTDKDAIMKAFEERAKPLFKIPGKLGKMLNSQLIRKGFIAFQAPEKRGKSFFMQELAMWARRAGCNVAMFQTGDLTEEDCLLRIHSYISGAPFEGKETQELLMPLLDCKYNQDDSCDSINRFNRVGLGECDEDTELKEFAEREAKMEYKACSICAKDKKFHGAPWYKIITVEKLNWRKAIRSSKRWIDSLKGAKFKLSIHENSSINVRGIKAQLEMWEHFEQFIPDIIIIDYADIMSPEDSGLEFRHRENERWKAMRALSQNKHCLVVTATQADAASYGTESQSMKNFSEDKRKYGHVTAMYSLNQTLEEKRKKIMRVGELVVRGRDYDSIKKVRVMQCLDISQALVVSY